MSERFSRLVWVLPFLLLGVGACAERDPESDPARLAEWEWLQEAEASLKELRDRQGELNHEILEVAQTLRQGDAEAAARLEELEAEVEELDEKIEDLADEFGHRLVMFINEDPIRSGHEPTELQRAALRMKSDEDIALAQEYIDKGGDYRRAISIIEAARSVDPEYERLQEELERVQALRFMSEERFEQVERGMTKQEVRALLGQVNLLNRQEYPGDDRDVLAWFYPTAPGGAAAGVWFEKDRSTGLYRVYRRDFDALDPANR